MRITIGELRSVIRQKLTPAQRTGYFHLTSKDQGDTFTLVPRLPREPYQGDDGIYIEDIVTPRISFAPTIEKAVQALENFDISDEFYVYVPVAKTIPGRIKPKSSCGDDPAKIIKARMPDLAPSDGRWWRDKVLRAIHDDERFKKLYIGCVPDADETGEVWATKSVVVKKIGTVDRANGWQLAPAIS